MFTPSEIARLQAESGCAPATIRLFGKGAAVREATKLRLERACRALGIELPARSCVVSTGRVDGSSTTTLVRR